MKSLFNQLNLVDVATDLARNIVSLRVSQNLFDDLSDEPSAWTAAQQAEHLAKPPLYQSSTPVIDRPFEDARWFNAIAWPFKHWQRSRFSDGSFGIWYGSFDVETTVYETVHHWYHGLLADAGFENGPVVAERKVYSVKCQAALLDFRSLTQSNPDLLHPTDYSLTQSVGARIHRDGHPGLVIQSVRRPEGENAAILNSRVLANPRLNCQLTYRLENGRVRVEKRPGHCWRWVDPVPRNGQ